MAKRERRRIPALITQARERDDAALVEIYGRVHPRLTRFVALNVEDPDEALDLVAEVLPNVLASIPHYDDDAPSLDAWCISVARGELGRVAKAALPTSAMAMPASYLDEGEHRAIERIVATGDMRTAMHQLPPLWQELLALRLLAGLSLAESAYVLEKQVEPLLLLQNRALGALGEWLVQLDSPAGDE